jgi:S-methylmethionine-dependent homocysteine/selenocysteine methylase
MYEPIASKLAKGELIILDGGTGTDIQRRGVPMNGETWCAEVNLTHPYVVRSVHEDYIRAGAEVVTANTYATSPLLFNSLGRDQDMVKIDAAAVKLAREACDNLDARHVAVAGSFSVMRPTTQGTDRTAVWQEWPENEARDLMRRKADGMAKSGCDLIMMEMMRDRDYSLWATEAAVATGLPVWVGISVEKRDDGKLRGFGRGDWELSDIVASLMATGAKVCSIMHTSPNDTDEALPIARKHWPGPLGAYPESGYFKMPDWQFIDIIAPDDLVAKARDWRKQGATLIGGCCGIGPDHIRALAQAFGKESRP